MRAAGCITLPTPADLAAVPADQLPALITELAALQAAAAMRLRRPASAGGEMVLLTATEAAERLRVPLDWVQKRSRELPFRVSLADGTVRYDTVGLRKWLAARTGSVR